jgi:integrase
MPRTSKPPAYRLHKATGQAVVTINRKDHYLGPHGSAKSMEAYGKLIGASQAAPAPEPALSLAPADLPLARLLHAYWEFAQTYYVGNELLHQKSLVKRLRTFAGNLLVVEFGPKRLRAFRQTLIDGKLARTYINHCVNRIRAMFKWGIGQELVEPAVLLALKAVEPLRFGKTEARESAPVKPVPSAWVDAVLPYCSRQLKAMIELQRLTGMRSGELVIMRTRDIKTSGKVWSYSPAAHKTLYRGHERIIYLGPKAQKVLKPWLRTALDEFLFSPAEVEAERRAALTAKRTTPLSCGNKPGSNKRRRPAKEPGDRYETNSYHKALKYALKRCNKDREKAGEPAIQWHPHQLRHLAATTLRREYGLEVARVVLGHKHASITETYALADQERAAEAMGKIG